MWFLEENWENLYYTVRIIYQIISYIVSKLNKPDSPELKFIAYDLYPLSPFLKHYEHIDTIDFRYLNQNHAPFVNILKKALHIELHNEKWFYKIIKFSIPPIFNKHDTLKFPSKSFSIFPFFVWTAQRNQHVSSTTTSWRKNIILVTLPFLIFLHNFLTNSNYLFFIQYNYEYTLKIH